MARRRRLPVSDYPQGYHSPGNTPSMSRFIASVAARDATSSANAGTEPRRALLRRTRIIVTADGRRPLPPRKRAVTSRKGRQTRRRWKDAGRGQGRADGRQNTATGRRREVGPQGLTRRSLSTRNAVHPADGVFKCGVGVAGLACGGGGLHLAARRGHGGLVRGSDHGDSSPSE